MNRREFNKLAVAWSCTLLGLPMAKAQSLKVMGIDFAKGTSRSIVCLYVSDPLGSRLQGKRRNFFILDDHEYDPETNPAPNQKDIAQAYRAAVFCNDSQMS